LEDGNNEKYIVNYNNDNIYGLSSNNVAVVKINESSVVLSNIGKLLLFYYTLKFLYNF